MSWSEMEYKSIKLKHHSVASAIELILTTEEEVSEGQWEEVKKTIWFEYHEWYNLKIAIDEIKGCLP